MTATALDGQWLILVVSDRERAALGTAPNATGIAEIYEFSGFTTAAALGYNYALEIPVCGATGCICHVDITQSCHGMYG